MKKILTTTLIIISMLTGIIFSPDITASAKQGSSGWQLDDPVKLATFGDVELWGEKSYDFVFPGDGIMIFQLEVKNTGNSYRYLRYDPADTLECPDHFSSHLATIMCHPQPNWFFLQPGETNSLQVAIDVQRMNEFSDHKSFSTSLDIDFTYKTVDDNGREESGNGQKFPFKLKGNVTTYSNKTMTTGKKCSVKICGYVKDKNGKPIKNANVCITSGYTLHNSVFTDNNGYYSVKVAPYYNKFRGRYAEYAILTRVPGYANKTAIVIPKKKTIKKNITLKKKSKSTSYKQTKKVDLGIQAYDLDASKDGSVVATVPFHSFLKDTKKWLYVTDKAGKLLFKKELPEETPYVDVSDDGEYIVVSSDFVGAQQTNTIIYDKTGTEIYRTPNTMPMLNPYTKKYERDNTFRCYCATLSHDNSVLGFSSTDGAFWLVDWKNNTVLWQTVLKGQVRTIDYSADNSKIYMTSGGGYAYCFDVKTGKEIWRSFIQAWGTDSALTSKYFIATTKNAGYTLYVMDAATGKKIWDYHLYQRGTCVEVSPDGKKLFWGNDTGGEYSPLNAVLFDLKTGKILTVFSVSEKFSAQEAAFSSDGKRILIKSGTSFGVYNTSTGEPYFEKQIVNKARGDSLSFSLYASGDLKYVIAGFNNDPGNRFYGQLYYFKKK